MYSALKIWRNDIVAGQAVLGEHRVSFAMSSDRALLGLVDRLVWANGRLPIGIARTSLPGLRVVDLLGSLGSTRTLKLVIDPDAQGLKLLGMALCLVRVIILCRPSVLLFGALAHLFQVAPIVAVHLLLLGLLKLLTSVSIELDQLLLLAQELLSLLLGLLQVVPSPLLALLAQDSLAVYKRLCFSVGTFTRLHCLETLLSLVLQLVADALGFSGPRPLFLLPFELNLHLFSLQSAQLGAACLVKAKCDATAL